MVVDREKCISPLETAHTGDNHRWQPIKPPGLRARSMVERARPCALADAAHSGLRDPPGGTHHPLPLALSRPIRAIKTDDWSVAVRAAIPRRPHKQGVSPAMALWAAHALVHQPIPITSRSMPGSSLLQTVHTSEERPERAWRITAPNSLEPTSMAIRCQRAATTLLPVAMLGGSYRPLPGDTRRIPSGPLCRRGAAR